MVARGIGRLEHHRRLEIFFDTSGRFPPTSTSKKAKFRHVSGYQNKIFEYFVNEVVTFYLWSFGRKHRCKPKPFSSPGDYEQSVRMGGNSPVEDVARRQLLVK